MRSMSPLRRSTRADRKQSATNSSSTAQVTAGGMLRASADTHGWTYRTVSAVSGPHTSANGTHTRRFRSILVAL